MRKKETKEGFTLIELSLALAFIGILSITIVLIINNTVQAYRRGLTLNEINTVGMELVDDIRVAVQNSPAKLDGCNEGENCTTFSNEKYGGFCTGRYSYVWTKDKSVAVNGTDNFYLAKIKDEGREICKNGNAGVNGFSVNNGGEPLEPEILLGYDEKIGDQMMLYGLNVDGPVVDEAGGTALYAVSFTLGTEEGVNIDAMACKPPKDADSKFNYCAINEFSFVAQAGGKSNEATGQ